MEKESRFPSYKYQVFGEAKEWESNRTDQDVNASPSLLCNATVRNCGNAAILISEKRMGRAMEDNGDPHQKVTCVCVCVWVHALLNVHVFAWPPLIIISGWEIR